MTRTAFALFILAASASAAHANLAADVAVAPEGAQVTAACVTYRQASPVCGEREVLRGHADLAPHHIAATDTDAVA